MVYKSPSVLQTLHYARVSAMNQQTPTSNCIFPSNSYGLSPAFSYYDHSVWNQT